MTSRRLLRALPICAALLLPFLVPTSARAEEVTQGWQWIVAPYIWGAGISGDTSLPDRPGGGADSEISAGDVLDAMEFGALLRVGGTSEKWRVLGDAAYIGLGKRSRNDLADLDFDSTLVELAGAYRPNKHVDILFGARFWDLNFTADFDDAALPDVDRGQNWVDPIVGLRLGTRMGESWAFMGRLDAGGFGVGSDLSWNIELLFDWKPTEHFSFAFGYRHLTVEDDWTGGAEDVNIDLALSGPEIGFVFHF